MKKDKSNQPIKIKVSLTRWHQKLLEYATKVIDNYSQVFIQALLSTATFSKKIQFLYCLLSSVALQDGPMIDKEGKNFKIQFCRSLENVFFLDVCWNFRNSW